MPYYSRPARPLDYPKIDADVLNSLKYLRHAPLAIQKPRLRQDTGVFVSDGAVPDSLHRGERACHDAHRFDSNVWQLMTELDAIAGAEPKDFHPGTFGKVTSRE